MGLLCYKYNYTINVHSLSNSHSIFTFVTHNGFLLLVIILFVFIIERRRQREIVLVMSHQQLVNMI